MINATIVDAVTRRTVQGKLIKRYPLGITVDDERGIRHYATFDRILSMPQEAGSKPSGPLKPADLF